MRINSINVQNFLGARAVGLALSKPVALIAGRNGAGKSSLSDAIKLALTADLGRVSLKKHAADLITTGQEYALAEIDLGGEVFAVSISSAGKITDSQQGRETSPALPYVLDGQRFARLPTDERRAFLFGLTGLKTDGPAVKDRLLAKGCNAQKVEQIAIMLRAGFDAACKEAEGKARDAKAMWKATAGGETWGKDKAEKWQPAPLEVDAAKAVSLRDNARAKVAEIEATLAGQRELLGAAKATAAARAEVEEQAAKVDRIKAKLATDEAELVAWQKKVGETEQAAGKQVSSGSMLADALLKGLAAVSDEMLTVVDETEGVVDADTGECRPWSDFEGLITRMRAHVNEFTNRHGWPHKKAESNPEAAAKLPEYQKALALMESAVANDKRDLQRAQDAAAKLADMAGAQQSVADLQEQVNAAQTQRAEWQADADKYGNLVSAAERREKQIAEAAALHASVIQWLDIASALAPDGIPAELLAEALGPINQRLCASAGIAEWAQVVIHSDMRITYGLRDYALISESEKWRVDAMIAEAIAHISGLRLVVLDRFDVLDLKGREDLLYWLDALAAEGSIGTALVFGTLKSIPAGLPENITGHWIDNGISGQLQGVA